MHGALDDTLNPPDCQDGMTAYLREMGDGTYVGVKRLDDGSYALLMRLAFTHAIALDANGVGYGRRYCFDSLAECIAQWQQLTGRNDEPTGWIARRPE